MQCVSARLELPILLGVLLVLVLCRGLDRLFQQGLHSPGMSSLLLEITVRSANTSLLQVVAALDRMLVLLECENSGLQPLAASLANANPTRWGPSLSGDADE